MSVKIFHAGVAALFFAVGFFACGMKTPPVPPEDLKAPPKAAPENPDAAPFQKPKAAPAESDEKEILEYYLPKSAAAPTPTPTPVPVGVPESGPDDGAGAK